MPRSSIGSATASPACASRSTIRFARAAHRARSWRSTSAATAIYVSDWTRNHANFFRSIELTKSMMFFILLMIVVVAAINIVATLVMIVKEKQTDIAILRTLGAAPRNVLRMFAMQGVADRPRGHGGSARRSACCSSHNVAGARRRHREAARHAIPRCQRVSHERSAGVRRRHATCCRCRAWRLLLCALATLYPAWRASRTLPAEALRHD